MNREKLIEVHGSTFNCWSSVCNIVTDTGCNDPDDLTQEDVEDIIANLESLAQEAKETAEALKECLE